MAVEKYGSDALLQPETSKPSIATKKCILTTPSLLSRGNPAKPQDIVAKIVSVLYLDTSTCG